MKIKEKNKLLQINKFQLVKFQVMVYCFEHDIEINHTDLNILALMGELGKKHLTEFSKIAVQRKILGTRPSVDNCVQRLSYRDFCVREGIGKIIISLNPKMKIVSEGNVVMNLRLISLEQAIKPADNLQKNSREPQLA